MSANTLYEHIDAYVSFKRAGGLKFNKQVGILRRFVNHLESFGVTDVSLPKEAVLAWNEKEANENTTNQRIRVNIARAFAKYLLDNGFSVYISEPMHFKPSNFKPYIFTNKELSSFFKSSNECKAVPAMPKRHLILPVLFRLLYSCGLRVSEATHLRVCDVDITNGILTILDTKFRKDRLVPVNPEMLKHLQEYSKQVLMLTDKQSPFFPSPTGQFYDEGTIYYAFRDILRRAGISHGGKGSGPRVHDFRHTFAVHCLRKWVLAGDDLSIALPYLSAFMGHDGLRYTQRYLRLTSDLYPDIVSKMEEHFDVLPEIGGIYEAD